MEKGQVDFRCGSDIQSHAAKGAIGIRIDGTKNFAMDNVLIENVANHGDLGTDLCGEYDTIEFAEGFGVDKDIQYGYTGNNVHGILTDYATGSLQDVTVRNVESWHGSAIGIAVYKGSTAEFGGSIAVDNIAAGTKMSDSQSQQLTLPNTAPFVCSVYIGPNSEADEYP